VSADLHGRTAECAFLLRQFEGAIIANVDLIDETVVVRLRRPGKPVGRHIALTATQYGLQAIELRAGCQMLTRIADAKFKSSNHLSAAIRPVAALNADDGSVPSAVVGEIDGGAA
jgi:hypothetical protein